MTNHTLRLALCSSQNNWGGGEQFLFSLGNRLISKGREVHWFAPKESALEDRLVQSGYTNNPFPSRTPSPSDVIQLRRLFLELGIQVFHSNDPRTLNWGSLALFGLKKIRRVAVKHTTFPVRRPFKYNYLSDIVACVSNAVQQRCIADGVWASKTRVIYAGAEVSELDATGSQAFVREQLNVAASTPVFASVGNLFAGKAYDRLIEAASLLQTRLQDFRVVICGEGPERDRLQSLIHKWDVAKHVKLLGFRTDANRWIAGSNAFVHPSLTEGLSLVAVQAQMLSVPVIAAKNGGLAEVLTSPRTKAALGWILQDTTAQCLAQRMLESLEESEDRESILRSAKELAHERFDVGLMADNFERIYLRLASRDSLPVLSKIPSPSVA